MMVWLIEESILIKLKQCNTEEEKFGILVEFLLDLGWSSEFISIQDLQFKRKVEKYQVLLLYSIIIS